VRNLRVHNTAGGAVPDRVLFASRIDTFVCPSDGFDTARPALLARPSAVCFPIVAMSTQFGVDFVDLATATPAATLTMNQTVLSLPVEVTTLSPLTIPIDVTSVTVPEPAATAASGIAIGNDTQRILVSSISFVTSAKKTTIATSFTRNAIA
jgi:hypothetical protein